MIHLSYRRHSFPPAIIQHAIWLYLRFTLSYRDVEELLAERGLEASYETVRRWGLKFGPGFARRLRRSRPRPSDRWHLDEMVVRISGKRMYLWRAVDHEGEVLDMLVQRRRDKLAAVRLMRKLLKKQGFTPKLLTIDKLGSYGSAFQHLRLTCHHAQELRKNNRAENSHQAGATTRAQDATLQLDPRSASSVFMPPSTTHSICKATSSHGQRCGCSAPKRRRNGKTPSQQHKPGFSLGPSWLVDHYRDKADERLLRHTAAVVAVTRRIAPCEVVGNWTNVESGQQKEERLL